ncbi:hypothetical protein PGT21_001589 [Puccinia graminis f. sp. tritici]|uniref:Uncharacterized protein n=1 Tax=Puccinia graminis f. sp. tritici TaxID=56615 RepID=A0A5B0N737_PUCGR|nr:hypothetical protein PGTUg99_004455 [Puccinia graminis f. sp. tritici]KAA1091962.1 hypothetical protein PGT21_001589 [Puccinia graminis f. sp. tritici]
MTTSPSANPITSPANPEAPQSQSNKPPATSELLDPTLAPQEQAPASEPHEALATSEAALAPGPQEVQDPPATQDQEAKIPLEGVQALAPQDQAPASDPHEVAPQDQALASDPHEDLAPDSAPHEDLAPGPQEVQDPPAPQEALITHDGVQAAEGVQATDGPLAPVSPEPTVDYSHSPSPKEAQIMRDGVQAANRPLAPVCRKTLPDSLAIQEAIAPRDGS